MCDTACTPAVSTDVTPLSYDITQNQYNLPSGSYIHILYYTDVTNVREILYHSKPQQME